MYNTKPSNEQNQDYDTKNIYIYSSTSVPSCSQDTKGKLQCSRAESAVGPAALQGRERCRPCRAAGPTALSALQPFCLWLPLSAPGPAGFQRSLVLPLVEPLHVVVASQQTVSRLQFTSQDGEEVTGQVASPMVDLTHHDVSAPWWKSNNQNTYFVSDCITPIFWG